jgi:hypothetical protein
LREQIRRWSDLPKLDGHSVVPLHSLRCRNIAHSFQANIPTLARHDPSDDLGHQLSYFVDFLPSFELAVVTYHSMTLSRFSVYHLPRYSQIY